jgi:hypothetical protein
VLNATFKIFELYRGGQIFWWGEQEFLEKNNEPLQVTETLLETKIKFSWYKKEWWKSLKRH